MIPPGALSGSRVSRLVNGSMLTIGTGLPALLLLGFGIASGIDRHTPAAWLLPVGFGISMGSLSYAFGRITLAAWSETHARRVAEPGLWPYVVCLLALVVTFASIAVTHSE